MHGSTAASHIETTRHTPRSDSRFVQDGVMSTHVHSRYFPPPILGGPLEGL